MPRGSRFAVQQMSLPCMWTLIWRDDRWPRHPFLRFLFLWIDRSTPPFPLTSLIVFPSPAPFLSDNSPSFITATHRPALIKQFWHWEYFAALITTSLFASYKRKKKLLVKQRMLPFIDAVWPWHSAVKPQNEQGQILYLTLVEENIDIFLQWSCYGYQASWRKAERLPACLEWRGVNRFDVHSLCQPANAAHTQTVPGWQNKKKLHVEHRKSQPEDFIPVMFCTGDSTLPALS